MTRCGHERTSLHLPGPGPALALPPAAFLLAAQRAFISCESLLRPAGVRAAFFTRRAFFVRSVFLLAAHRAFINCESLLRLAGVSPPFFVIDTILVFLAGRTRAETSKIDDKRFSKASIWCRIAMASCKASTEMSTKSRLAATARRCEEKLPLFELARVLVHLDHVASVI